MFFWIPEENLDGLKGCKKKLDGHAHFELRIGNMSSMVAGAHDQTEGYYWINSPADVDIAIAPLLLLEGWEELSKDKQPEKRFVVYRRTREGERPGRALRILKCQPARSGGALPDTPLAILNEYKDLLRAILSSTKLDEGKEIFKTFKEINQLELVRQAGIL